MSRKNPPKKLVLKKNRGKITKKQNKKISGFEKSKIIRNWKKNKIQDETKALQVPHWFNAEIALVMKSYDIEDGDPWNAAQWLNNSQGTMCHIDDSPESEERCYPRRWASNPFPENSFFNNCIENLSIHFWDIPIQGFLSFYDQNRFLHRVLVYVTPTNKFCNFVTQGLQQVEFIVPEDRVRYTENEILWGGIWVNGNLEQQQEIQQFHLILRHEKDKNFNETAQLLVYIFRPILYQRPCQNST